MTYSSKSTAVENSHLDALTGLSLLRSIITGVVLFVLGLFLFFAPHHAEAKTKKVVGAGMFKSENKSGGGEGGEDGDYRHFPSFTKTGKQTSCDTVEYRLRFAIDVDDPAAFFHPPFVNFITNGDVSIEDVLPPGLSVTSATISGDVTDGGGGLPVAAISTTANPNDTLKFTGARFSNLDLDGDGSLTTRSFEIVITAKIDPAAFPAPATVDNQASITFDDGVDVFNFLSHDPALPDDGDPQTGEPTSVQIDLTDCDTPPGGGGTPESEPCFKVEKGEVECAKDGGGAFIYNMPVGPEMAGRSIELVSLTPGVTIAPASQIVPPGGGVLSWTITGATPGMTVSLSVVGMELGAGPAEGWGLCCAQRIDIEIPEGIDCPPEDEGEPDIKVEKKADAKICSIGGGCDFTITVSNAGDAPYTGEIVLEEVTSPGNATLAGPPNAPWTCVPGTSPMACAHPSTTLNPGESVELKLSFIPGPDWVWRDIKNCAEYDYHGSSQPVPFGRLDNDKACASIPIDFPNPEPEPDPNKKVDLELKKEHGGMACSPDGICYFFIYINNVGTENFNGPLTVVDNYTTGAPLSAEFSPTPPWNCTTVNPSQFRCESIGNINLPVGASTRIKVLTTIDPARVTGGSVENCATLDAVARETNLDNQKDCSKIPVTTQENGEPKIEIEKVCRVDDPGTNADHWTCKITVTNSGTAAPQAEVSILEKLTLLEGSTTPEVQIDNTTGGLSCVRQGGAEFDCSLPGSEFAPGTSKEIDVSFSLQAGHRFENCATAYERDQGPEGGELGKSCVTGEKAKEEAQCTPPLVANDNGFCVCPQGTRYRNGKCVGGENSTPPPPPPAPPVTKLCKKLPGQYRTSDNRCLCRKGTELNRSRTACVKTKPDLCKLKPGQVRTRKGQCICPRGTTFSKRRNRCVKEQCTLKPGQIRTRKGQCICPRGTTFSKRRNRCVKEQCTLKPGQIRTRKGQCICPRGTTFSKRRDRCVSSEPPRCKLKRGQIRTKNGQCVCPSGTTFSKRRNRCVTIVVDCPKGYTGRPPKCRKIITEPRPCPRGTVRKGRRCVPVRCPKGMTGTPPNCRKIIREPRPCPRGTVRKGRRCVSIRCPKGMTGTPPNCRKIIRRPRPCRPGYIRKKGRCVVDLI